MFSRAAGRFVVATLVFTAACASSGPVPLADAEKSAIRANNQKFVQGVVAKNWGEVAAMFATEATLLPPNQPLVKSRSAIQSWMESIPTITAFAADPQEIEGVGDLAYERGTYTMTSTPPGAPAPVQEQGKYIAIHRRQADGTWLITNEIFNSDVPVMPLPSSSTARN